MEYEVEVIPGLETAAIEEVRARAKPVEIEGSPRDGWISVRYEGSVERLNRLRSVVAVYRRLRFEVSRPRALLGHANFQRILQVSRSVIALGGPNSYTAFRISAAGADSSTFQRLKDTLAHELGLTSTSGPADLQLIVRRPFDASAGWDLLVRTSPRPLAARPWRVCDLPGALNASIAHAMVELTGPSPGDRFLNLGCGSGTLLIERLALAPAALTIGVDHDARALACAGENARASGCSDAICLLRADAGRLPLPPGGFTALAADLPFGMLIGNQRENARLYPRLLREAARVALPGARFAVITASRRLFEATLASESGWHQARALTVRIPFRNGYVKSAIYLLRRAADGTMSGRPRRNAAESLPIEERSSHVRAPK